LTNQTIVALLLVFPLALWLLLGVSAGPALADEPYRNPIIGDPSDVPKEVPDPFVLKYCGEYWLYCSGDPIDCWHSEDLVHWNRVGPVFSTNPKGWDQADLWAPEVVYDNGTFYMYYCATTKSSDWRVGEADRRIGVATASQPQGPFVDVGHPLTQAWGIDADVLLDPTSGLRYLFYSHLDEPQWPGAGIDADRLLDPAKVANQPWRVTHGSEAWEDKDADPYNGSLRYTNEGPTALYRNGKYYVMYSGGSWDLPTYALAYAMANKPTATDWRKFPPILRTTHLVDGPGHNCVVKAPNNFDDICIYHARTVPFVDPWNRLPFADRLYWNGDRMYMDQPSLGDLTPPDRPAFWDNFNRPDGEGLGANWDVSGKWAISGEHGRSAGRGYALARTNAHSAYILEASVRLGAGCPGAGLRMGDGDERHHIDVVLEPASHALVVDGQWGAPVERTVWALPANFRFDVFHRLTVSRHDALAAVQLDGVDVGRLSLAGSNKVGLVSAGGTAIFDGFGFTSAFEDNSLKQTDAQGLRWRKVSNETSDHYELSVSVRPRQPSARTVQGDPKGPSAAPRAAGWWLIPQDLTGLAATDAVSGSNNIIVGGFDENIWPFARFWVLQERYDGLVALWSAPLPRGFLYREPHTIRMVRQGTDFRFYLDGKEMVDGRVVRDRMDRIGDLSIPAMGPSWPALYSQVPAEYSQVSWKELGVEQNLVLNGGFESEQWDDNKPTAGNPWKLVGACRPNESPAVAHSGNRRLIVRGGVGSALQEVTLTPGHYVLDAFVICSGKGKATVGISTLRGQVCTDHEWRRVSIPMDVTRAGQYTLSLGGEAPENSDLVGFDDIYLYRR
jgi:GH43 family beta-xylosidase